jgi:hypothetical protein
MILRPSTAVQVGLAAALVPLYVLTLGEWASRPGLFPIGAIEIVVLGMLLFRLLIFLIFPAARRMRMPNLIILFGSDVWVVLLASGLFAATGNLIFAEFSRQFSSAWVGAAPIVYPLLAIFLLVRSVGQRGKLFYVLPAASAIYGLLSLLTAAMIIGDGTGGLGGVTSQILGALKGTVGPLVGSRVLPFSGAIVFASLATYALVGIQERHGGEWVAPLALGIIGTALMVGWAAVTLPAGEAWITMGVPALLLVGATWSMTRE